MVQLNFQPHIENQADCLPEGAQGVVVRGSRRGSPHDEGDET
jgi:hypothetical protein